jgi:hypothetical protein
LGGFFGQVVANRVVAIDATGKAVWPAPFTLIANNNESPVGFTVDASGRIYVATHDAPDIPGTVSVHLYALLPNGTSAPNWPISFTAMYEPPAIAADGTIYQMDELTTLRALRPSDGSVVWQQGFCCYGQGAIALDSAGNLYAGTDGNYLGSSGLWSWSPGGAPRWTALSGIGGALLDTLFNTPAISPANTIYVASLSGTVYAFNTNGTLLPGWPFATGSPAPSDSQRDPLAVGISETVYVKTVSGVFAINPNGTQKWSFSPGGDGSLSPVVVLDKDENVYCAFGNTVYSLTSSGTLRWSVPLNAPGRLYIGASGVLHIISAHQRLYSVSSAPICQPPPGLSAMYTQIIPATPGLDSCPPKTLGLEDFSKCLARVDFNGDGTVDCLMNAVQDSQQNKFQLWCMRKPHIDPLRQALGWFDYYALYYIPNSGSPKFAGTCKYEGGDNSGLIYYSATSFSQPVPTCFISSEWDNMDAGLFDDEISYIPWSACLGCKPYRWTYKFNVDSNITTSTHLSPSGSILGQSFQDPAPDFNTLPPVLDINSIPNGAPMTRATFGDVNVDGQVDCGDLDIIRASFGKKAGELGIDARADVNLDGVVDIRDIAVAIANFTTPGAVCPSVVTVSNVLNDIANSLELGLIDNHGIANSLSQKIQEASDAAERGQTQTETSVLMAFINEVRAQSGKHVAVTAALVLVNDANSLLNPIHK